MKMVADVMAERGSATRGHNVGGRAFHVGIVLQKKEDRGRELEDRGNSREWEERREIVERELTSAGRRVSN